MHRPFFTHYFIRTSCLVILFSTSVSFSCSQSKDIYLDIANINFNLLEHLVKLEIDSIRRSKNRNNLFNNDILFKTAQDHAWFLSSSKEISHLQSGKKKTAQDRAEFYGSKYFTVAENILSVTIHKPISDARTDASSFDITLSTYLDVARYAVGLWADS
ncbi:MAG: hypothetical protein HRT72_10755 [Flavobacteriales bacterium]|nr:hypothetical protein [Flavobacteriales bacterium]